VVDGAAGLEDTSPLRDRRVLFTRLLVELIVWANEQPDWEIAFDEVKVFNPRWVCINGKRTKATDAIHGQGSFHYEGLAADLLLYVNGAYIWDGDHPAWRRIAERWESMHPLCTSGRRWNDSNHLALGEGSKEGDLP
jgi:hypothetical protein